VTLSAAQLQKFVGKYRVSAQVVLTVTLQNGRLFVQENDEPKQELLAQGPQDFYSAASTDEFTFALADGSAAQQMVLHADGKDFVLKRLP
jgi:hypothetical protein